MKAPQPSPYDSFEFSSRKSTIFSAKGIVSSSQPLASEIGLSVLRAGGNAADAAIATAAALNVTEPNNCGIGGDVFALYYCAATKTVTAVNGSGRSPKALNIAKARELGITGTRIPRDSVHSITVPGAVAAWVDIHETLGGGKLSLAELMEPAAQLAEEGFPVHPTAAYEWSLYQKMLLKASPASGPTFLINGKSPKAGQLFYNPDLARTFRDIGKGGKQAFYSGRIAVEVASVIQSLGGVMTVEDLVNHETVFSESLKYTYGPDQLTVHECPPNGQGLAALIAMGILDVLQEDGKIDLDQCQPGSSEWYHALIEAMRLAFADVHAHVGDIDHMRTSASSFLTKDYLRERAAMFSPKKAAPQHIQGYPINSSDTVYFNATDKEGNAMSMIMSNFLGFGSGVVPAGCGFSLQNRGGGFYVGEGHPNSLDGGKKPFHTIIPAMVTKGDELYMAFGLMGGVMQPQGHLQVLMNLLHQNHHPQAALDFPRFCIGGNNAYDSGDAEEFFNSTISLEQGISEKTVKELRALGHEVEVVSGYERIVFGKGQMIRNLTDEATGRRIWAAGSDPRGDGVPMPQV